jgi:hypothetical protein
LVTKEATLKNRPVADLVSFSFLAMYNYGIFISE